MEKNLKKAAVAAILVFVIGLSAGCGELQKAIDKIKTQNVDFYQGIYDGDPVRTEVSMTLLHDAAVPVAGPLEANAVSVWDVAESVLAMQAEIPDIQMGLSGRIANSGATNGRVYIFLSPTATPAEGEALLIGSVAVGAGQTIDFADSQGFDQTSDEVQANLRDYFNANPMEEIFHVFLFGENVAMGALVVNNLSLDATPTFCFLGYIPEDFLAGKADNVKDINSVEVGGTFVNNGNAPARFTWVVGPGDANLTIGSDLILDAWLQPGQSMEASNALVVPEGLRKLKSMMKNLVDGDSVKAGLFVTSSEKVDAQIQNLKVECVAEVGI